MQSVLLQKRNHFVIDNYSHLTIINEGVRIRRAAELLLVWLLWMSYF